MNCKHTCDDCEYWEGRAHEADERRAREQRLANLALGLALAGLAADTCEWRWLTMRNSAAARDDDAYVDMSDEDGRAFVRAALCHQLGYAARAGIDAKGGAT